MIALQNNNTKLNTQDYVCHLRHKYQQSRQQYLICVW